MQSWPGQRQAERLRQWPTLQQLVAYASARPELSGAILVGSFASGQADELSDIDLIIVARDDAFEQAWSRRCDLHGDAALSCWDVRHSDAPSAAHKWLTTELVLVECLIVTRSSGFRLARPRVQLTGEQGLADRLPGRPPIERSEMRPAAHPIERSYDEFKSAVRGAFERG